MHKVRTESNVGLHLSPEYGDCLAFCSINMTWTDGKHLDRVDKRITMKNVTAWQLWWYYLNRKKNEMAVIFNNWATASSNLKWKWTSSATTTTNLMNGNGFWKFLNRNIEIFTMPSKCIALLWFCVVCVVEWIECTYFEIVVIETMSFHKQLF